MNKLIPSGFTDSAHGTLYVQVRRPSRLRYWWRTLTLFLEIVWRKYPGDSRLDMSSAWTIARNIYNYKQDARIWNSHPQEAK